MSNTVKQLGFIPTNRGEYDTTGQTRYYKDNVVQYRNGSYICTPVGYSSSNLTAYTTDAPYQDGDTQLNPNWKLMASVGLVDSEPTAGSNNLVKSKGVQNELALGAVYDVSAKNPIAGPNNDGKWESLSALLSDANLSTLIPISIRKGGMSIKFIQSSDNNYVQFFLTKNVWSANEADWEKMNLEEEVSQLGQEVTDDGAMVSVDIEDLNLKDYAIKGDGTFGTEASNKHACIPVNEGDVFYIKHTDTSHTLYVAFATSDAYSSGGVIPLVSGTTTKEVGADYTKFVVPAGASYFLFSVYTSSLSYLSAKKYETFMDELVKVEDDVPARNSNNVALSGGIFNMGESIAQIAGKGFVKSGTALGNGTYDGAIGSTVVYTSSSSWTCASMVLGANRVIKIDTTIYGSSHYGVVFVDSNEKVVANLFLKGSSANEDISVILLAPANASKVYVNRRNTTYPPVIYSLSDARNILKGNILRVLTTNCGSFHYGEESVSLDTYKANWRKMLNESGWDVWCVEDWSQYFDYGIESIDSQDAIVADTDQGTYPLVKSGNDRTRVFYRGGACKLEEEADYTSSIHHVSINVNGKEVHLFSIYFVSGSDKASQRAAAASSIISKINAMGIQYAVVLGDFNAWSASEYDVWKTAGYKVANCGYLGEIATLRDIPADNIIVTPTINILKVEILDTFPLNTDHKPMKAVLMVK